MEVDLARALNYPYPRPAGSFVFDAGTGTAHAVDPATLGLEGRHALLAVGSNAAPEQLARKFDGYRGTQTIPVVAVEVVDHDVVYAAGVAGYGSVPATLVESPGTRVAVHVTVLDDGQRDVMNKSEGLGRAYDLVAVDTELVVPPCSLPRPIETYVALAGPALAQGQPVALEAIPATGRSLPAWTETDVLGALAEREELDVTAFVTRVVVDAGYRRAVVERLRAEGLPARR